MVWLVILYFLLHGDARSRNFLMSGTIFILPPYAEINDLNIATFCFLPTAGIEPMPPAQQESKLSITPLPLDYLRGYLRVKASNANFRLWHDFYSYRITNGLSTQILGSFIKSSNIVLDISDSYLISSLLWGEEGLESTSLQATAPPSFPKLKNPSKGVSKIYDQPKEESGKGSTFYDPGRIYGYIKWGFSYIWR